MPECPARHRAHAATGYRNSPPAWKKLREVERLFLDVIDAAERGIYDENQFMAVAG